MKSEVCFRLLAFRQFLNGWRRITILFILLSSCFISPLSADPISGLLSRILPEGKDAKCFKWKTVKTADQQTFTISCDGRRVTVEGSDYVAIATGINWYLQHYAGIDISWNSPTAKLPNPLPQCKRETHVASVPWRYYLNFCTHSYSMAFWGWQRWQQELDWMALHGVNMPLAITGMECVWREVLQQGYGYATLDDVNTFVSGSSYYGWFFMNNLTAWGGPQPESWYVQRQELARKIFRRMTDFGMSPVVPGYVGMVPVDFLSRADASKVAGWQPKDIVDGGRWCSFVRPAFVNNTARLQEFAAKYYAAFYALYGDVCTPHHWAIDPFHEGGVPRGVTDAKASVAAMWAALTAYDKDAVWVAQHWQTNPTTIVTHTIPRGQLIILDLHGDSSGDTECSGHHTTSTGQNHEWVWGQVSNFGGNVGLFGRMDRLIHCFYTACNDKATNGLVGIGALPEGIENNPMLYDLLYALPWTTTDYTRATWLADYVKMRYGVYGGHELSTLNSQLSTYQTLLSVWTRLGAGIYNCPNDNQQGTTESVFLMRPSLSPGTVSSWAYSTWYWNFADLRTALREMLSVKDVMQANANYRYDLVDLARQVLADYGKELLEKIREVKENQEVKEKREEEGEVKGKREEEKGEVKEKREEEKGEVKELIDRFLQLILDQDRLLGTLSEFRLGRWTEAARALASSGRLLGGFPAEEALYERNARMLLTTWGDRAQCENGGLHDYANREWNGLLASYYYPRWKAFFQNNCQPQPWFADFEWPFATGVTSAINSYLPPDAPFPYGTFRATPEGDEIAIVQELFDKYFNK